MKEATILLDPTAETSPSKRGRVAPPASLEGLTIALLDIGKVFGQRVGVDNVRCLYAVQYHVHDTDDIC